MNFTNFGYHLLALKKWENHDNYDKSKFWDFALHVRFQIHPMIVCKWSENRGFRKFFLNPELNSAIQHTYIGVIKNSDQIFDRRSPRTRIGEIFTSDISMFDLTTPLNLILHRSNGLELCKNNRQIVGQIDFLLNQNIDFWTSFS